MAQTSSFWMPVVLAGIAGSATALGGALVLLLPRTPSDAFLSITLAFAAGVMVFVSLIDLYLPIAMASGTSFILATGAMLFGMAGTSLLGRLPMPEPEDLIAILWPPRTTSAQPASLPAIMGAAAPARVDDACAAGSSSSESSGAAAVPAPRAPSPSRVAARARNWRLGFLLALVLTAHNLPEGLAVGLSAAKSRALGITLAIAIFLHNVAEGIVIAVPVFAATGDRALALGITAASGLSEPLGALIGVSLLRFVVNTRDVGFAEVALSTVLCAVGGVMVQVSRAELLPHALRLADVRTVTGGFIAGAALIAASLAAVPSGA